MDSVRDDRQPGRKVRNAGAERQPAPRPFPSQSPRSPSKVAGMGWFGVGVWLWTPRPSPALPGTGRPQRSTFSYRSPDGPQTPAGGPRPRSREWSVSSSHALNLSLDGEKQGTPGAAQRVSTLNPEWPRTFPSTLLSASPAPPPNPPPTPPPGPISFIWLHKGNQR